MNKYQAYRHRIRQDPEKLDEYRRKERERKKMYRDRKGNVPRPCTATVPPPCTATVPRLVTLPLPKSAGGNHASSGHQSEVLRTFEQIEREWHDIWGDQ